MQQFEAGSAPTCTFLSVVTLGGGIAGVNNVGVMAGAQIMGFSVNQTLKFVLANAGSGVIPANSATLIFTKLQ